MAQARKSTSAVKRKKHRAGEVLAAAVDAHCGMEIEGSAKSVTPAQIKKVETQNAFAIPAEYKDFLLQHNGGHPQRCCFSFGTGPYTDSVVGSFFGINAPSRMNLAQMVARYADRLPAHFLPIADDPGGNLILISCAGRTKGAIYFWDHEAEGNAAVYRVARSFAAFLEMLTEEEDKDVEWYPLRVSYKDGTSDTLPSNVQFMSLDRRTIVDILSLKPGETIEFFGEPKTIVSVQRVVAGQEQ